MWPVGVAKNGYVIKKPAPNPFFHARAERQRLNQFNQILHIDSLGGRSDVFETASKYWFKGLEGVGRGAKFRLSQWLYHWLLSTAYCTAAHTREKLFWVHSCWLSFQFFSRGLTVAFCASSGSAARRSAAAAGAIYNGPLRKMTANALAMTEIESRCSSSGVCNYCHSGFIIYCAVDHCCKNCTRNSLSVTLYTVDLLIFLHYENLKIPCPWWIWNNLTNTSFLYFVMFCAVVLLLR